MPVLASDRITSDGQPVHSAVGSVPETLVACRSNCNSLLQLLNAASIVPLSAVLRVYACVTNARTDEANGVPVQPNA
jgi:hypothetical protein